MSKIKVEVEIPDGEYCRGDGAFCTFLKGSGQSSPQPYCGLLDWSRVKRTEDKKSLKVLKHPACPLPSPVLDPSMEETARRFANWAFSKVHYPTGEHRPPTNDLAEINKSLKKINKRLKKKQQKTKEPAEVACVNCDSGKTVALKYESGHEGQYVDMKVACLRCAHTFTVVYSMMKQ